jgi:hypothetical protein
MANGPGFGGGSSPGEAPRLPRDRFGDGAAEDDGDGVGSALGPPEPAGDGTTAPAPLDASAPATTVAAGRPIGGPDGVADATERVAPVSSATVVAVTTTSVITMAARSVDPRRPMSRSIVGPTPGVVKPVR